MPVLKTLVEDETKVRFQVMAKARGLSESEFLRVLVLAAVQEEGALEQPVEPDLSKLNQGQMTVRMPRFLVDGVEARAKSNGMAASRWVASLVQSNLLRQPVMTHAELLVLQASVRELAAIGRNINQIAKALNLASLVGQSSTDDARWKYFEKLNRMLEENKFAIRELVRASKNSWGSMAE